VQKAVVVFEIVIGFDLRADLRGHSVHLSLEVELHLLHLLHLVGQLREGAHVATRQHHLVLLL